MSAHSTSVDAKVERPSLRVACGARAISRVRVAVDDGDRSTRKRLGERSEQPDEIGSGRHAPPGGSVSHENSKLLGGLAIDAALTATRPESTRILEAQAVRCG